ncbi:MAG: CsbD family protein [Bryobacteraceae bacterium]
MFVSVHEPGQAPESDAMRSIWRGTARHALKNGAEFAFANAHFAAPAGTRRSLAPWTPRIQTAANVPHLRAPGNRMELEENMNWDQIEGKWKQFTGSARERWGKLTDNDWETIAGKKDQLIGRIQERYGVARAEAEKQADEWSLAQKRSGGESHAATRL